MITLLIIYSMGFGFVFALSLAFNGTYGRRESSLSAILITALLWPIIIPLALLW